MCVVFPRIVSSSVTRYARTKNFYPPESWRTQQPPKEKCSGRAPYSWRTPRACSVLCGAEKKKKEKVFGRLLSASGDWRVLIWFNDDGEKPFSVSRGEGEWIFILIRALRPIFSFESRQYSCLDESSKNEGKSAGGGLLFHEGGGFCENFWLGNLFDSQCFALKGLHLVLVQKTLNLGLRFGTHKFGNSIIKLMNLETDTLQLRVFRPHTQTRSVQLRPNFITKP